MKLNRREREAMLTEFALNPVLLVCGEGPGWQDDLEDWWGMEQAHDTMAINRAARNFPCTPRHAFSYHAAFLGSMRLDERGVMTHSLRESLGVKYAWRLKEKGGSSALMACRVALNYLGYSRIVLAGVPLAGEYRRIFFKAWQQAADYLAGRVRSMSGATRELLGPPDEEWLHGL